MEHVFYCKLHKFCGNLGEAVSWETGEGGLRISYANELKTNYPWIYADFGVSNGITSSDLRGFENKFDDFCKANGATLEQVKLYGEGDGLIITVKMVYVERHIKE